mmetsp:Transcript_5356/g.7857  ORF Transcript_5356/g.7857 Transcript_5356/m.7857 type:complete len:83 (-) Transcript_5356:609-857(-)
MMQLEIALPWFASCRASFSNGWYSTIRVGSTPQLAEIMILGLQSSILVANSLEANPPNTTLCTAPILAHASMETIASGIMGM